ncbi:MAG: ThiF family adenylyltransferase [Leadbetterella sp.]
MLSGNDLKRFSRQIILPNFGEEAQLALKNTSVLIIGLGGLGGPAATYLASAGIGKLAIVEYDTVSESNLHRQVLFSTEDIGFEKIKVGAKKLKKLYPDLQIDEYPEKLTSKNALEIFINYDIVVDASDNFPTRYLVNDACEILNKPFVFAAIHQWEAQIAVFNHKGSTTYRDLFPEPPQDGSVEDCSTAGVLGPLAGMVGSLQAMEVIKLSTKKGQPLINQILLINLEEMFFSKIKIKKIINRPHVEKLIDYEVFCGIQQDSDSISKEDFFNLEPSDYVLIDVRSIQERDLLDIGGHHIPLDELEDYTFGKTEHKMYVFYCSTGKRAKEAVRVFKQKFPKLISFYISSNIEDLI